MSLPIPHTTSQNVAENHHFDRDCERLYVELVQKSRGDLRQLLSSFFSFLHRRTDLYCITDATDNNANVADNNNKKKNDTAAGRNMGFREGEAETIIIAAFRQFPLRRVTSPSSPIQSPPSTASSPSKTTTTTAITTTGTTAATATSTTETSGPPPKKSNRRNDLDLDDVEEEMKYTQEGLQIPIGNGGIVPHKYRWTQTLEECTILLPCPNDVNSTPLRGKDVRVTMLPQTLRVQIIIINPTVTTTISDDTTSKFDEGTLLLLDGTLSQRIVPSESTWTMESGVLQIILYKSIRTFWDSIFADDTIKIDTSLVDSRRNIDTYDDVTQAHIRKIIHEQQQQSMGLPTSDDAIVTSSDGDKPRIPSVLPKGVEYIDQEILDSKMKELGK